MSKENTKTTKWSTLDTWSRLGAQQLERFSNSIEQLNQSQDAALQQGRDIWSAQCKMAQDWQAWAMETGKGLSTRIFKS